MPRLVVPVSGRASEIVVREEAHRLPRPPARLAASDLAAPARTQGSLEFQREHDDAPTSLLTALTGLLVARRMHPVPVGRHAALPCSRSQLSRASQSEDNGALSAGNLVAPRPPSSRRTRGWLDGPERP